MIQVVTPLAVTLMTDSEPSVLPPRLTPDRQFPPYSYVTGRFPHPTRDPAGHSFGHAPLAPPPIDPESWQPSRDYLFACDLFNYGYYWESHEVWESLWQACGRNGPTADFLKGLIKLAAAGVKAREGRATGVKRHATRAAELFSLVQAAIGRSNFLGLDLDWLISMAKTLESDFVLPPPSDASVQIVFAFRLLPRLSGTA